MQYFIIVLAVLIGESAIYTIAWAWPSCMGIGLETEELVRALQSRYGSAGQEQFTAAMDLAQTTVSKYASIIFKFVIVPVNNFSLKGII